MAEEFNSLLGAKGLVIYLSSYQKLIKRALFKFRHKIISENYQGDYTSPVCTYKTKHKSNLGPPAKRYETPSNNLSGKGKCAYHNTSVQYQ